MKVYVDDYGYRPTRAHDTDAGLDLRSPVTIYVPAKSSRDIDTGVHIQLPHGTAGVLVSKSGLNVRNGITSTGLIDEGYTGSIVVKLYNHSTVPYTIKAGDKISQLVVVPVLYEEVEITEEPFDIPHGSRGDKGFGSSGR